MLMFRKMNKLELFFFFFRNKMINRGKEEHGILVFVLYINAYVALFRLRLRCIVLFSSINIISKSQKNDLLVRKLEVYYKNNEIYL